MAAFSCRHTWGHICFYSITFIKGVLKTQKVLQTTNCASKRSKTNHCRALFTQPIDSKVIISSSVPVSRVWMTIRGLLSSFPPHCMLPPWPGIRGDSLNLQNCILWSVAAAGHRVSATYKRTIGILLLLILSSYYYYHFSEFSQHTTSFPNCILNKTFAFAFLIICFSLCMLLNTFT